MGILGGIIEKTNVEKILQLNLLKTDFFADSAYPSYLYYNPYPDEKLVEVPIGSGSHDIYDAVSNTIISTGVSGTVSVNIPADGALLAVILPTGGMISYELEHMLVNGVIADYRLRTISC